MCDPAPFCQMSQSESSVELSRAGGGFSLVEASCGGAEHYGGEGGGSYGGGALWGGGSVCDPAPFSQVTNQKRGRGGGSLTVWGWVLQFGGVGPCVTPPPFVKWANQRAVWS